jgi:acetoin utilization protein AcuB
MLVKERMSHPVITIRPDTSIHDAFNLMRGEKIRRLPVVDKRGRLTGIVSDRDLLHAEPSAATTLSIWEVNYLLSKLTVEEVMTKPVITVAADTPIEEAARIMADNKIGGLPVLRDGKLVGIITETDLFHIFLELLGAREPGVRLSLLVPNVPKELAKLTKVIAELGGNILALGTFLGESVDNRQLTLKVDGVAVDTLVKALEPVVERIVDVRGSPLTEQAPVAG